MNDVPRILHTPTNTANNPLGMSRAERELGFVSDVVDFAPAYLKYEADETYDLRGRPLPMRVGVRAAFLARAARKYDVFHYNAGAPLIGVRTRWRVLNELWALKRLNKRVVVTWQGCDVRPRSVCTWCTREHCAAQAKWRALDAAAMLRHADRAFYLNPDLGQYLPGARFLPYASVDIRRIVPTPLPTRETVRIAHAPTNSAAKGTPYVLAAVEALKSEGLALELDLIEGVSHAEAMARIEAADLLVDQLGTGWYGGVALEAMSMGRPVVSYIDERFNPFDDELPIVRADPASIRDVLRGIVEDRELRLRAALAGREFAVRHHDPLEVVRRAYEGLMPFPE